MLTPLASLADDTNHGEPGLGFVASWDSRLGDQWGVAFIGEKSYLIFTIGGYITSAAEDNATQGIERTFANNGSFDTSSTIWSASYTRIFSGSLNNGGLCAGIGYSSANVDVDIRNDTVAVSGTFEDSVIDAYFGYVMPVGDNMIVDLRLGYGFGSDSSYEIVSEVQRSDGTTFRQTFGEDDFGENEFDLLDASYGSIQLIYRF